MKLIYDPEKLIPKPKKPIKPIDHSPHLDKMRLLLDEEVRVRKAVEMMNDILEQHADEIWKNVYCPIPVMGFKKEENV